MSECFLNRKVLVVGLMAAGLLGASFVRAVVPQEIALKKPSVSYVKCIEILWPLVADPFPKSLETDRPTMKRVMMKIHLLEACIALAKAESEPSIDSSAAHSNIDWSDPYYSLLLWRKKSVG